MPATPIPTQSSNGNHAQISVRNCWKVFGAEPEKALQQFEGGATRSEVLGKSGAVLAVRDVSFDVQKGETFVVMGLSGSGKSTLLRCLPRLIEPTRGQVLIEGRDIGTLNASELREVRRHRMSMVFQHFGLLPHRRIIDNVAYGLEVQGVKKPQRYAKAREVIEIVNLKGWENHYPSQLSGGMQQRVGLARALAVDPDILLFDEPFSALDPLIRREMQDELLAIQSRLHKTLVFITHDFSEAIKLGTHIAIMKDGAFVQVGSPEEVVLRPATDYVADFTRDVSRLHVLRAGSLMQPPDGMERQGTPIPASTRLDNCLAQVLESESNCPVTDETGIVVGVLNRQSVLRAVRAEA